MLESGRKYLGRQVGVHPTSGKRIFAPFGHCEGEAFDVAIAHGIKDGSRVHLLMDNQCDSAGDLVQNNRYPGRLLGVHPTSGKRIFGVGCKTCGEEVQCTDLTAAMARGTLTGSYSVAGCSYPGSSLSGSMTPYGLTPACGGTFADKGASLQDSATPAEQITCDYSWTYGMLVFCATHNEINTYMTPYIPYGWTPLSAGTDCIIAVLVDQSAVTTPAIITRFYDYVANPLYLHGVGRIGARSTGTTENDCVCENAGVEILITE